MYFREALKKGCANLIRFGRGKRIFEIQLAAEGRHKHVREAKAFSKCLYDSPGIFATVSHFLAAVVSLVAVFGRGGPSARFWFGRRLCPGQNSSQISKATSDLLA